MKKNDNDIISNPILVDKIFSLRKKTLSRNKKISKDLFEKPVASWIKKERLLNEVGKEFTIILRSKGCSWALSSYGGCSMCGYINDACLNDVKPEYLKKQFDIAFNSKLEEIESDKYNYVLKLFNSGSFFDDSEIPIEIREYIFQKISKIKKIKELVIESRPEYITEDKLIEIKDNLKKKYVEIGIGLETTDDFIRNNYINKGFNFEEFKRVLGICKEYNIGVKAYLLFKPPFLNEQSAIDDCINSILLLSNLKVNSISINPLNIQKGTLAEYLWFQNRYRPPWFYSLFKAIRRAFKKFPYGKTSIRILSDPSGAGTKRGIHNCLRKECNNEMKRILREFILTQDISKLKNINYVCNCKNIYYLQRRFY
ncbi:MAG: archaeosine biosynthesis radical SAM protein RaSEA [Promethearchaeia archaeon]